MRTVKKLLLPFLLIIFGSCFSLLAVEGVIRLLLAKQAKSPAWSDRPEFYYKYSESENMQDYPWPDSKPEGSFRIVVLGDSFSFATQMQFDDAFPKKMERILNLNATVPKTEVFNFGVPGYSTSHEVGLVAKAAKLSADLVLLQITLNDPQRKPYTPRGIDGENPFQASKTAEAPESFLGKWKTLSFVKDRIRNTKTHNDYVNYYFDLFNNQANWKEFEKSLKRIARKTKKKNIKLAAVVFPLFGLPLDDHYPFHPLHKKTSNLLEEIGITHLDLFEAFKGIPLDRIQVIPGRDFHPNEIGHRLAAEKITSWLHESALIPKELGPQEAFSVRFNIEPKRNKPLNKSALAKAKN